jgi:hypothetical protein
MKIRHRTRDPLDGDEEEEKLAVLRKPRRNSAIG